MLFILCVSWDKVLASFHFHIMRQISIRKWTSIREDWHKEKAVWEEALGEKVSEKRMRYNNKCAHCGCDFHDLEQNKHSKLHLSKNSPTSGCSSCLVFVINETTEFCSGSRQPKQQSTQKQRNITEPSPFTPFHPFPPPQTDASRDEKKQHA